jgi:hypothetical protein
MAQMRSADRIRECPSSGIKGSNGLNRPEPVRPGLRHDHFRETPRARLA